jgi:hypothetical protein
MSLEKDDIVVEMNRVVRELEFHKIQMQNHNVEITSLNERIISNEQAY